LTPKDLITALRIAERTGHSLFISGPPGIGKSQITYQFARETERNLTEIRPAQWDAAEVKGLADFGTNDQRERVTIWTRPGWMPTEPHAVLLIEEIDKCTPAIQAAMLEVTLDKRIGKYRLPEDCLTIATANRLEDRSGSFALSKALGNRFAHVNLEPSNEDWERWALRNGIDLRILAYLRWKPEHLHKFDPAEKSPIFASPRQWEMLSRTLSAIDAIPAAAEKPQEHISGHVGPEIGAEFHAFSLMYKELPDPRKIDSEPEKTPVPAKTSARWALVTALARTATPQNIEPRFTYIKRIGDGTGRPLEEYQVIFARDLTELKSPALATPAFTQWALEHADLLGA
jgi:hypothetical protein